MKVPVWVAELASAFWANAKVVEPFPRSLRRPIARAVPMTIILVPELSIHMVINWLRKNGIECDVVGDNRRLQACLVARNGHGFAFIDGTDSAAEQRFSLAHELAHFLRDYVRIRSIANDRLGAAALEVLDAHRAPTTQERFHSVLRGVPVGFHVHLLDRQRDGRPASAEIERAEQDADLLAFELLAPADQVFVMASTAAVGKLTRPTVQQVLVDVFGLPERQAGRYSSTLLPSQRADPFLLRLTAARDRGRLS